MIEISNLSKNYGELCVLKNISKTINKGDIVAIIGPSGSGKSTFLRCLNLLETPSEGSIKIGGADITDKKTDINKIRQKVSMVFQHFNLFANKSVLDNLILAPVKTGLCSKEEAIENAKVLLKKVGLLDKIDAFPHKLSGGQKQRIAIARAILKNPRILLLDEATSALDSESEYIVQEALVRVMENRTTVVVAHRLTTIRNADIIVVVQQGKLVEQGNTITLDRLWDFPNIHNI